MRLSNTIIATAILSCAVGSLCLGQEPRTLQPIMTGHLSKIVSDHRWDQIIVKDVKAAGNTVSFLIQGKSGAAILITDKELNKRQLISLGSGLLPVGLVHTAQGNTATILVSGQKAPNEQRKATLVEFDVFGRRVNETPISTCYIQDGLLAIDGIISTACPDGAVIQHSKGVRLSTWIRSGSSVEALPNRTLAIVDKASAQALLQDLNTNRVSPVTGRAPEIASALEYSNRTRAEAVKAAKPGEAPLGSEIIVMDTASDSTGWYQLIYPYHPSLGPAVVKFNAVGQVVDRFRCKLPHEGLGMIHKMEVYGDSLLFASSSGSVLRYQLK